MIDGVASDPFSARGLPPLQDYEKTGTLQAVIEASRKQFANPREEVEMLIAKWHEDDPAPKRESPASVAGGVAVTAPLARRAIDSANPQSWPAECVSCGKEVILNFQPDGIRPIFCKNCLAKSKEDRRLQTEQRKSAKQNELANLQQRQTAKSTTVSNKAVTAPKPVAQINSNNSAKELSLSDLTSKSPVDFRGKPIATAESRVTPVETELADGQEIILN
jgi:CxxC-x17-CxxC domain-containing protein